MGTQTHGRTDTGKNSQKTYGKKAQRQADADADADDAAIVHCFSMMSYLSSLLSCLMITEMFGNGKTAMLAMAM